MRTIKLAYGVESSLRTSPKDYKVVVVKNSTDYCPGQILKKTEVDMLCGMSSWDITVVRYNPELDR